jgi:hypothetical protein
VTKPSGAEYEDMKPVDHRRGPGAVAKLASPRSETSDFAKSSSTVVALKTLAEYIAAHLDERAFSVVFEDDLERCWPSKKVKRAERDKEIQSFAKSQGWTVAILTAEPGIRAIFRTLKQGAANYEIRERS